MSPSDVFTPLSRRFTNEQQRSLDETRALYGRITARDRSGLWSRPGAVQRTSRAITEIVGEHVELPAYQPLLDALDDCQQELLALETQIFAPIEADLTQPLTLRGQLELNAKLRARDDFHAHEDEILDCLGGTISVLSCAVIERAPSIATGPFTVPFICAVPDPAEFLDAIIATFFKEEHRERNLFAALNEILYRNMCDASGVSADAELTKPLVWPSAAKLAPAQLVPTYFVGTPLEALLLTPVPLSLPDEQRFAGHWIIAPPGRGKTTLLHAMFVNDVDRDASIVVIDSKGDLLDPLKKLECIKDRLLLIEPSADCAFALNPLDVSRSSVMQAVNLIEYIMASLLDAKFTALQSTLFRNVVPAIIEGIEQPTLETFKTVMVKGLPPEALRKLPPHSRSFFENRETGFNSKTYESTRKEVVWRLDYLLTNPVLRSMFSAVQTKLDIGKEMDAGKVILINNSKAILTDEGAEFLGRFFIALIVRAAQQRSGRPADQKKPCYVYIDECQTVISKDTRVPTLLDECRSQKIALILAHQRTAQLSAPVLDAAANCAIRMANSDDEAKYLADKIRLSTDVLRSLPQGSFGAFIRDFNASGFVLNASYVDMFKLPQMSDAEFEAIRARMRLQFASVADERMEDAAGSDATAPPASPAPPDAAAKDRAARQADPEPDAVTEGSPDPGEPASEW